RGGLERGLLHGSGLSCFHRRIHDSSCYVLDAGARRLRHGDTEKISVSPCLRVQFRSSLDRQFQNWNFSPNIIFLPSRAAVTLPNVALVWAPVALHCAVVPIVLNCVWLNVLNVSHRNCSVFRSVILNVLKSERSWLLNPGRRNLALLQLLPMSPRPVGREKTAVLNHESSVR